MSTLKYHAVFSVDTNVENKLDGNYIIEDYNLKPCISTPEDKLRNLSRFILEFNYYVKPNNNNIGSSESTINHIEYRNTGIKLAKTYIAWLVLATNRWARLSSQNYGPMLTLGPYTCHQIDNFDVNILENTFHVDKTVENGEYIEVHRPSFSYSARKPLTTHKLPSDFPRLTKKLFSLCNKEREKFLHACFSYQFALNNWTAYPTVSILSLVSAVETMMADEYTSGFCKDANRKCNLKKDVREKFRAFFEQTLQNPLSKELKKFLNDIYSKRSKYVHKVLLGEVEFQGIPFITNEKVMQFKMEQRYLNQLVNAALMEWIKRK